MQFNVSSLLQQHTGAMREYVIDDDVKIDGERHHMTGQARMDRTPDGIFVRAEMSGTAKTECSRCLRSIEIPVIVAFEEEYVPTVDVVTGGRVDPPEGREEAYRINARHFLDICRPSQLVGSDLEQASHGVGNQHRRAASDTQIGSPPEILDHHLNLDVGLLPP